MILVNSLLQAADLTDYAPFFGELNSTAVVKVLPHILQRYCFGFDDDDVYPVVPMTLLLCNYHLFMIFLWLIHCWVIAVVVIKSA